MFDEGLAYLRERLLKARVGLLWSLLLASSLLTRDHPVRDLPWLVLASGFFIASFRLWDDLADLNYDSLHHSERCLVRSRQVHLFRVALGVMLATCAGLIQIVAGCARLLSFLVLGGVFLIMYRVTQHRSNLRSIRAAFVLAKYPAFVLLVAPSPSDPTVVLMALGVYLPPMIDEILSSGPGILLPAAALLGLGLIGWLRIAA